MSQFLWRMQGLYLKVFYKHLGYTPLFLKVYNLMILYIYSEMITRIHLANICTISHSYLSILVVSSTEFNYCYSNFEWFSFFLSFFLSPLLQGFLYIRSYFPQTQFNFLSNLDAFYFLSWLISLTTTSNIMLRRTSENGHSSLVPDLRVKTFSFLHSICY